MEKLSDDEKARLQAKIEQARTERIQLITESLSEWKGCWSEWKGCWGGGAIDRGYLFWISILVFILGNALLNGVFPELNSLWVGWVGGFLILVVGAFACAIIVIVDIIKSPKNRESEWTRSDPKSLRGQIGRMLLWVGLGVVGIFMIIGYFSDLNDVWEGIVVDKWTHKATLKRPDTSHLAVEYEGKRHSKMVRRDIWKSVKVGDKLIKKKGSFELRVVHTHRK